MEPSLSVSVSLMGATAVNNSRQHHGTCSTALGTAACPLEAKAPQDSTGGHIQGSRTDAVQGAAVCLCWSSASRFADVFQASVLLQVTPSSVCPCLWLGEHLAVLLGQGCWREGVL